ncbi:alpha/beta hydrolase [soil metagenome]
MAHEVREQRGSVDGLATRWFEAGGGAPVLYVHGAPNTGALWRPFLELTGGFAPDLPGFGASAKPSTFDYSIPGYETWLRTFAGQRGLARFSLVVHDWGAAALALAQSEPQRIERLVVIDAVPLLPGYEWHVLARQWRRPVLGELAMGFTTKLVARRLLRRGGQAFPAPDLEELWAHFDHGTQRAILKLYRSAPPVVLARAGESLDRIMCPALVLWGAEDPYIPSDFAQRYAEAVGGETEVRTVPGAGHWPWFDEPSLVDEVAAFLGH